MYEKDGILNYWEISIGIIFRGSRLIVWEKRNRKIPTLQHVTKSQFQINQGLGVNNCDHKCLRKEKPMLIYSLGGAKAMRKKQ